MKARSPKANAFDGIRSCNFKKYQFRLYVLVFSIFVTILPIYSLPTLEYTKRLSLSYKRANLSSSEKTDHRFSKIYSLRGGSSDVTETPKMPTLFNTDEMLFDRYSACLAATEGLRRARDLELSSLSSNYPSQNILGMLAQKIGACKNYSDEEEAKKRAEAKYLVNSGKVIRALGLTVPQFNTLGRKVMDDPNLKERVMEQAYLYRMTATLSMPRTPLLQSDAAFLKSNRRKRIQMFAKTAMEIEVLRQSQMEKLCKALQVDNLPTNLNISDEKVLPLLSPKVRAVVEAFPLQAEEIVRKYGLNSDEFNRMLDQSKKDALFRWKVQKSCSHINGIESVPREEEESL